MYIGSCTTILWKLRASTDNVTVPYLVFHWAQYVCSMVFFSFVQFCVSGPALAWNKTASENL